MASLASPRRFGLLKTLLPKLPLMVRVAVAHVLRLSETAPYLDLRSAVVVAVLRSLLEPDPARPRSISSVQRLSTRDPGVRGRLWVSTYAAPPPPETGARDALARAIEALAEDDAEHDDADDGASKAAPAPMPAYAPAVEAEWTGHRAAATADEPLPAALSERARFHEMMAECRQPTTVLYLHGGAYYLLDPASHRPTTARLARATGGRCYSVRYRLAPQHPFPAALLDAWLSYLTLLYPPPDAFHAPVAPEHLVVAGDSAGGNLGLALLQLILEVRRRGEPVVWHGQPRHVPLPAAIACNSPWLDITHSSPAFRGDAPAAFDYLPKPAAMARARPAPCAAWPADPPRKHLYVADGLAAHPLVSPITARSWRGAPPVYLCTGWELLAHEDRAMAKKLAVDDTVAVVFEEYEAMPHCFALVLPATPAAARCFDAWAAFIRRAVEEPARIEATATTIAAPTLRESPLSFDGLSDVPHDEVRRRVVRQAREPPPPASRAAAAKL